MRWLMLCKSRTIQISLVEDARNNLAVEIPLYIGEHDLDRAHRASQGSICPDS